MKRIDNVIFCCACIFFAFNVLSKKKTVEIEKSNKPMGFAGEKNTRLQNVGFTHSRTCKTKDTHFVKLFKTFFGL